MASTTPLLAILPSSRKDFLDNLRCTLTALLVTHHAIIETANTTGDSTPAAIIVTLVKTFLWSMFFFVSGYSTALSQANRPKTLTAFLKKGIKVNLPALLYAIVGQWALFFLLSHNWPYIFGNDDNVKAYAKFTGPVPYIILLIVFDLTALLLRKLSLPSSMIPNIAPKFTILIGFITLALYTFVASAFVVPTTLIPDMLSHLVYDIPDPSFPLSHLLAYTAGWHFRTLKRSILSSSSRSAFIGLVVAAALSSVSLYFAQIQWPPLADFIRVQISNNPQAVFVEGGLNPHTIFFSVWSSFTLFSIPVSLISLFFHANSTSSAWGWLGRNTYIQTYIHMIPILVAKYHLRKVRNEVVKCGLLELIALGGTWMLSSISYALVGLITEKLLKIKRYLVI